MAKKRANSLSKLEHYDPLKDLETAENGHSKEHVKLMKRWWLLVKACFPPRLFCFLLFGSGLLILCTLVGASILLVDPSSSFSYGPQCTVYDASLGSFHLFGSEFAMAPPPRQGLYEGKGVIIAASGQVQRHVVGAYVTAYLVRKFWGSEIPIHIYYVGKKEGFSDKDRGDLLSLGSVKLIDLEAEMNKGPPALEGKVNAGDKRYSYLYPTPRMLKSYAAKIYAVYSSPFREVMLLDAGATPFVKPEDFFGLETYKEDGFMEFGDYVDIEKRRWEFLDTHLCVNVKSLADYFGGTESDSSCILLDKVRHWDSLMVGLAMNGPLQKKTYTMMIGDKDTWILSLIFTNKPLSRSRSMAAFLMVDYDGVSTARKIHGQLQLHEEEGFGYRPLYFNNQLYNFTEWPGFLRTSTYYGTFKEVQGLFSPGTFIPDCTSYPTSMLHSLPQDMIKTFDAVTVGLREVGLEHCVCRDDWAPTCIAPWPPIPKEYGYFKIMMRTAKKRFYDYFL